MMPARSRRSRPSRPREEGPPDHPDAVQTARRTKLPIGFPTAAELAHLHSVFDEVAAHVAKRRNAALARTLFPAPRRVEAPPPRRLQVVIDRPRRGRRALAVYLQGNGKLRGWPGAASIQLRSVNRKITAVDTVELKATGLFRVRLSPRAPFTCTTYASIEATCPTSCDFKGSGCYAQTGYTRFAGIRLDRAAAGVSGDDVIREEATAIRAAFTGGRSHRTAPAAAGTCGCTSRAMSRRPRARACSATPLRTGAGAAVDRSGPLRIAGRRSGAAPGGRRSRCSPRWSTRASSPPRARRATRPRSWWSDSRTEEKAGAPTG
jgi:hypothetical protein